MSNSFIDDYNRQKNRLREQHPPEFPHFTVNEAPHFFSHDIQLAVDQNLDTVPINKPSSNGELPFHCEVKLNQIDHTSGICFRSTATRIKDCKIVRFEQNGVPESAHRFCKLKSLAIYRAIYPDGLSFD